MNGLVIKKNSDKFSVLVGDKVEMFSARNLKDVGIFVGDKVEVDKSAINKVKERKNLLIRPPLANVDKMIIVISKTPKPDFLLVDKLIIFCVVHAITPVLCVNKSDLGEDFVNFVKDNYLKACKVISCSTINDDVHEVKKEIYGITTLAGQSAVGKSSIINALLKENVAVIGDFSKKVERGKQTTRIVELYEIEKGKFLADTAGFSKLDEELLNVNEYELKSYYPEFLRFAEKCKYKSCLHLHDQNCEVIKAVKSGKISELRYENYKILQENLKSMKKF